MEPLEEVKEKNLPVYSKLVTFFFARDVSFFASHRSSMKQKVQHHLSYQVTKFMRGWSNVLHIIV